MRTYNISYMKKTNKDNSHNLYKQRLCKKLQKNLLIISVSLLPFFLLYVGYCLIFTPIWYIKLIFLWDYFIYKDDYHYIIDFLGRNKYITELSPDCITFEKKSIKCYSYENFLKSKDTKSWENITYCGSQFDKILKTTKKLNISVSRFEEARIFLDPLDKWAKTFGEYIYCPEWCNGFDGRLLTLESGKLIVNYIDPY